MIDLTGKKVIIRTQEEFEKILDMGEKQGFTWDSGKDFKAFEIHCSFPILIMFCPDKKTLIYDGYPYIVEASKLLGTKELTATEFIKGMQEILKSCENVGCYKCVLSKHNTKSKTGLCIPMQRMNSDDVEELIKIIKSGKTTIKSQDEIAIEEIQKFIENPDRMALTNDFMGYLKLAVEKLRKSERDEV